MFSRYPGKAGALERLADEIVLFFESKGFFVSKTKELSETTISIKMKKSVGSEIAKVSLRADANDSLTVCFESVEGSVLTRNSSLMSLFGGGFLTLKSVKNSEIMERLEKEFWIRTDEVLGSS